jgi:glycosyltransferase involved in cell wall biosynthesis
MRIVHIIPGSGGTFYCENCLRDSSLVRAVRARGHDVVMAPMYLPVFTDDPDLTRDTPVFFGGINVYLKERVPFFRMVPRWLDGFLDSRWLLGLAARHSGSTRARDLGPMTLAMIRGDSAYHREESDRMLDWLLRDAKPDVIHIGTIMLIGLSRWIRERTDAPILISLQDEDVWIDALDPAYRDRCWAAICELLPAASRFVTVSDWYRTEMLQRLPIPPDRFDVVRIGIDTDPFGPADRPPKPPVIGYLSRMGRSLGLETLFDAFLQLRRMPGMGDVRLKAMGGRTGDDRGFLASLRERAKGEGVSGDVEFLDDFSRANRAEFLRSVSVVSVPIPAGEAFGTFMIEAMASGVPVVQPRVGAFPEIVERTGGGWLYEPRGAEPLAQALAEALRNPDEAAARGRKGREAVLKHFTVGRMAGEMDAVYRATAGGGRQEGAR